MTVDEMDAIAGRTIREFDEAKRVLQSIRVRAREVADSYERVACLLRESPAQACELAGLDYRVRTDLAVDLASFGREIEVAERQFKELEGRKRGLGLHE